MCKKNDKKQYKNANINVLCSWSPTLKAWNYTWQFDMPLKSVELPKLTMVEAAIKLMQKQPMFHNFKEVFLMFTPVAL